MASSTWHSGKTGIMETEENQWLPGARGTVLYYIYSRSLWDYQNSEIYPKSAAFEVWRDGSGVNSTDYSSRVEFASPTLCSLQPHNHPGDPMPSLTSVIPAHTWYILTQTHRHTCIRITWVSPYLLEILNWLQRKGFRAARITSTKKNTKPRWLCW